MIRLRHSQQNLGEVFFAREAQSLMEPWMKEVDEILQDEPLLEMVYERLARRWPKSRKRGRKGTPAEVVLRLMVLKHVRNWSYEILERSLSGNLITRWKWLPAAYPIRGTEITRTRGPMCASAEPLRLCSAPTLPSCL